MTDFCPMFKGQNKIFLGYKTIFLVSLDLRAKHSTCGCISKNSAFPDPSILTYAGYVQFVATMTGMEAHVQPRL